MGRPKIYSDTEVIEHDRASTKRWKDRNPNKVLAASRRAAKRHRDFLDSFKTKPCLDCGNLFPTCCMDFDHVRGEKLFNIGSNVNSKSYRTIADEVAKCDLVCANCHRIREAKRGYSHRWH